MGGTMRLKNKKTGEIIDLDIANIKAEFSGISVIPLPIKQGGDEYVYNSLAELNEEWEDYEELKEYWYVSCGGRVLKATPDDDNYNEKHNAGHKQIGNYFETEEEAKKIAEKLKAWKRLKDKGFRFDVVPALGHCDDEKFDISIIATMPAKWWYNDKVVDDIHYVFGGEE